MSKADAANYRQMSESPLQRIWNKWPGNESIEEILDVLREGDDEVLTFKEGCAFLKVSEPTVRRWVKGKEIPFHKAGRQIRFLKNELIEWLRKR